MSYWISERCCTETSTWKESTASLARVSHCFFAFDFPLCCYGHTLRSLSPLVVEIPLPFGESIGADPGWASVFCCMSSIGFTPSSPGSGTAGVGRWKESIHVYHISYHIILYHYSIDAVNGLMVNGTESRRNDEKHAVFFFGMFQGAAPVWIHRNFAVKIDFSMLQLATLHFLSSMQNHDIIM